MARTFRVIEAFNDLEPAEQRIVAEQLAAIYSAGAPVPAFEEDRLQCEAESWVRLASTAELLAYAISIEDELMRRAAKGRRELRRLFMRLWERLSAQDRMDFVNRVTSGGTA